MMSTNFPFKHLSEEVQFGYSSEASAHLNVELFSSADLLKWEHRQTEHRKEEFLISRSALAAALNPLPLSAVYYNGNQPKHEAGHISISHTKSGAIAAYSATVEVGIDIEGVRPQISRIAQKFIRADEEKYLASLGATHAQQLLWGIKESLFKLFGSGNVDFKKHLHITSLSNEGSDHHWSGTAWIYATNELRQQPIQCFVQGHFDGNHYYCLATHRKAMIPFNTQNLQLRQWRPNDAHWLFRLNQDPEVVKYTGDSGFSSEAKALELIQTYPNYQRDGYGRWMVTDLSSNTPLGWCGLKKNSWGIDLGFRFFREHWGKGIATKAARAALALGEIFEIDPIIGRTLSSNTASSRVLEKVGMVQYETLPFEDFIGQYSITEPISVRWSEEKVLLYKLPN
ncbi:MAG: GNAT family N-acetyltransferase [Schleiferiaceae bacterium]|nr:GNAT family N-acetyltransferase [Schleiferiaceae bacterium]